MNLVEEYTNPERWVARAVALCTIKFTLERATKAQRGSRSIAQLFL